MKTIRSLTSIVTERFESTVIRLQPGTLEMCAGCEECRNGGGEDDLKTPVSTGFFSVRRTDDGTIILCMGRRNIEE